ncbi:XF1762 family protein [Acetobacter orientalis]|uniref:XF1762 family protein n=1 Tax=Acetobacter orientalis TaxID=146474 RepID=UPI000A8C98DF
MEHPRRREGVKGKLYLAPVTIKSASAFVGEHHRHNKPPQGALFALGAGYGENMVGVAIVGRPVSRHRQDGLTAEVTRCCVIDSAPKNTCSFLYGAAWRACRALGWQKLITYTLQSESGASLRGSGWRIIAQTTGANPANWQSRIGRDHQDVTAHPKFVWEQTI